MTARLSLRALASSAAILLALLSGACKPKGGQTNVKIETTRGEAAATGPKADPAVIKIGHFASMTGSEATFGQSTDKGIRLALDEIPGGVRGKPVEVITYDDQGKPQEAGTAVTRLITDDEVTALLGEVASTLSIAGGRVAQKYGVPMISPSSTNPQVTEIGDMVFRVCFIDPYQGYVVAKFTKENLNLTKVAILYDQAQTYSTGLGENFRGAFTGMGGTITTQQAYSGGDPDFSAQLTTIRGTGAEAIFIPGYYTDVGNIALQARNLGITAPLLGGDGWDSTRLAEIAREAIEGCYYSNHYSHEEQRPEVKEFVDKFQAKYGEVPDGLAALGYDAAKILFAAMERAPSLSGKDLAAAIASTTNYSGVTGVISMDANRDAKKSAVMVQLRGGVPRYVATIDPPQ